MQPVLPNTVRIHLIGISFQLLEIVVPCLTATFLLSGTSLLRQLYSGPTKSSVNHSLIKKTLKCGLPVSHPDFCGPFVSGFTRFHFTQNFFKVYVLNKYRAFYFNSKLEIVYANSRSRRCLYRRLYIYRQELNNV